jgi:transcriptional repressor NrdR
MVCIYCGNSTQVTNSRLQRRTNGVWRRRSCTSCEQVFTTIEQADLAGSIRITHNGRFEPYNRDQLLMDVYEACKHRTRALEDAQALILTITADILTALEADGTIAYEKVQAIVRQVLDRFDPVAATVYAAYHK